VTAAVAGLAAALPAIAVIAAGPAVADGAAVREAVAEYSRAARYPLPAIGDAQVARLVSGRVVRVRDLPQGPGEPQRVVGLHLVSEARERLWIAALDPHFQVADGLTEVRVTPPGASPARWYGRLDLPWPFHDRHWVVEVLDNPDVPRATRGAGWEHAWDLASDGADVAASLVAAGKVPGIDPTDPPAAVYTPVNRGAWLAVSVEPRGTLLGYHVTSVVGGEIPDRLVADYTLLTLDRLLRGVASRARGLAEHYAAGHPLLSGGDGIPILPFTSSG